MPYRRTAEEIIDHWRDCLRDLEIVGADSTEGRRLQLEVDRLRGEYQRLVVEAARDNGEPLSPFPVASEDGGKNR